MNKASLRPQSLALGCALGLAATGFWAAAQERAGAPSRSASRDSATNLSVDLLAAIPKPAGNSPADQAVNSAIEKTRRSPDDDKAWVNLGDVLMQRVRESADPAAYGHAERAYQKALSLEPKSAEAMVGLAWVHGGRHEFDKSITWAKRAIALDPQNHAAYGLLGEADVELGNYEAALQGQCTP